MPQPDALLPGRQAGPRARAGARALLLDERGFVTEASTANILVYYRDEGLISPPKERILPGVTRRGRWKNWRPSLAFRSPIAI